MLDIHKDSSNITYEFILSLKGEVINQGDGWQSPEEIKNWLENTKKAMEEK
jgi:hypothetical protein